MPLVPLQLVVENMVWTSCVANKKCSSAYCRSHQWALAVILNGSALREAETQAKHEAKGEGEGKGECGWMKLTARRILAKQQQR